MYKGLNSLSSADDKKSTSDVVYESLMEYFFDKVIFINLAFSDFGGGGSTSTTDYDTSSRIIDTAEGRLMAPGRSSRLRCQFYLKNPSKMTGYILSPNIYDSQTLPSPLTNMNVFRAYVGIKFLDGKVYAVTKQAGESERIYLLDLTLSMFDGTFTDTYSLEIKHSITHTEIIINNISYGSFSSNMIGSFSSVETFYPFFSTAVSTDGTSVNITAENIQFIQSKQ